MDLRFTLFLETARHRQFAEQLMEEAFPEEERPSFSAIQNRSSDEYRLCVIENGKTMVGIMAHWDFGTVVYVEHFAIGKELRNRGLGASSMEKFLQTVAHGRQMVLEVDPPTNTWALRRIAFYQRLGLQLNAQSYMQPPYHKGGTPLPMLLISRTAMDDEEFERTKRLLHQKVYGVGAGCGEQ